MMSLARESCSSRMSTNAWLRERATRPRSSAVGLGVHARRAARGRDGRGRGAAGAGHPHDLHQARREPDARRRRRRGDAALPRRPRQGAGGRARGADLGEADAARARSRPGALLPQPAAAGRSRGRAQELRLDRHGELAVRRSDARSVPPHARALGAHRHRAAGVSVSHGEGHRIAAAARRRDPDGRRARISSRPTSRIRRKRTSTRTSTSCRCRLLGEEARRAGGLLHIATHDPRARRSADDVHRQQQVPKSAYEYAMLYGIQRPLQQRLVAAGGRCACSSPTASTGSPWYMRRLAERPANVWFVVKNRAFGEVTGGAGGWGWSCGDLGLGCCGVVRLLRERFLPRAIGEARSAAAPNEFATWSRRTS